MSNLIKSRTYASSVLVRFARDQAGSTAIEYTLIASGISIAIVVAVNGIGSTVVNLFQSVTDSF